MDVYGTLQKSIESLTEDFADVVSEMREAKTWEDCSEYLSIAQDIVQILSTMSRFMDIGGNGNNVDNSETESTDEESETSKIEEEK